MNEDISVTPNEVTTFLASIRDEDLPAAVSCQVKTIKDLSKEIDLSIELANRAQKTAANAETLTKEMGFWGGRRDAINALQNAGLDLSKAVCSNTEALKLAFEALTKLSNATKYLFALGVSSLAVNRMVVSELELQLKGASAEQLDGMARKEVLNVIRQLKAQEDILIKQDKLATKVRFLDDQLQIQVAKDVRHDEVLHLGDERDKQQDELLRSRTEKDLQHDEELRKLETKLGELEAALISLQETQKTLKAYMNQNSELINKTVASIEQLSGGKAWIPLGLSLVALIGTAILFVLRFQ